MSNNITGPDPAVMDAINRGNKVVFFDIAMGDDSQDKDNSVALGRIKLELFVQDVSLLLEILLLFLFLSCFVM